MIGRDSPQGPKGTSAVALPDAETPFAAATTSSCSTRCHDMTLSLASTSDRDEIKPISPSENIFSHFALASEANLMWLQMAKDSALIRGLA